MEPSDADLQYFRSLIHPDTSTAGEKDPDDWHFTAFADKKPGGKSDGNFDYDGHLYTVQDEHDRPYRALHPEGAEYGWAQQGSIFLWDTKTGEESYGWYEDEYYNGRDEAYGCTDERAGESVSQGKKKRGKRKHRRQR